MVRTEYLPSLRYILTKPLRQAESDPSAIESLLQLMQDYCISREQFDYVLSVTSFKTKGSWGEDPMKEVPTKVKSAFTRTFNQTGQVSEVDRVELMTRSITNLANCGDDRLIILPSSCSLTGCMLVFIILQVAKCSLMLEEPKKKRGGGKTAKKSAVDDDPDEGEEEEEEEQEEGDEEGGDGEGGGLTKTKEEDEEEEVDGSSAHGAETLRLKLAKRGMNVELKGGQGGSGGGKGKGRGAGSSGGRGRGAAAAGGSSGGGRGRGRGKK